ncbi:transmembrane protein 14C-like [Ptychodera flava]|uniref:transmembrane protein 14C-like n=1 Tax=Ptychodera flava TaxID=63121 RepID=UPI00396A47A2
MGDVLSFGYAVVVTVGGIIGYVKAGSTMSLMSGLCFGALAFLGAYQTSQNPRNFYIALGTAAILAGVMGMRFSKSGKFMPAGLVCILSCLQAGRFVLRLM